MKLRIGTFKMREALPIWKDYVADSYFDVCLGNKKESYKPTKLRFAWFWLKELKLLSRCWLFGHDIVEGGHAGPDSGCITWECKRCGWSAEHTLY